jgi:carbonic anhydrase
MKKTICSALAGLLALTACERKALTPQQETLQPAASPTAAGRRPSGLPNVFFCPSGESPINLRPALVTRFRSEDPVIRYEAFPLSRIVNTGENLQVVNAGDNYITLGAKRYNLVQFHFHRDSEHALNGRKGIMEVHLVHTTAAGDIAVLGAIIQQGPYNHPIGELFEGSPREAGEASLNRSFNPGRLLPKVNQYFTYNGSLTAEPFTQEVTWIVFKHPLFITREQLRAYEAIYEEANARPIQPLNDRKLFFNASTRLSGLGRPGNHPRVQ